MRAASNARAEVIISHVAILFCHFDSKLICMGACGCVVLTPIPRSRNETTQNVERMCVNYWNVVNEWSENQNPHISILARQSLNRYIAQINRVACMRIQQSRRLFNRIQNTQFGNWRVGADCSVSCMNISEASKTRKLVHSKLSWYNNNANIIHSMCSIVCISFLSLAHSLLDNSILFSIIHISARISRVNKHISLRCCSWCSTFEA